jgi:hypothetical protein
MIQVARVTYQSATDTKGARLRVKLLAETHKKPTSYAYDYASPNPVREAAALFLGAHPELVEYIGTEGRSTFYAYKF